MEIFVDLQDTSLPQDLHSMYIPPFEQITGYKVILYSMATQDLTKCQMLSLMFVKE